MKPRDFFDKKPLFDVFAYFDGHCRAWGLFEDRFGTVRRQFTIDIIGTLVDDVLRLEENFVYDDGQTETRVWHIHRTGPHAYQGVFDDIIGVARGRCHGSALHWTYDMTLKIKGGRWRVSFDDWMFLQPDGIVINRARMKKWGLKIGDVSVFFYRTGTSKSVNGPPS